jgi:basic amino acid/polyamine antiporter, APA family
LPFQPKLVAKHYGKVEPGPELVRGVGLASATALNMLDMIGVGPFITIPLIIAAMGGPQAMLGWILGALLSICDGLVWAELGAAMPHSGGSYGYLSEIYGPKKLGRLISFLFVWQLSFSAPLSIASGCIGLSQYAAYFWRGIETVWYARTLHVPVPLIGRLEARVLVTPATFLAIGVCLVAVFLLYRRITGIARLSKFLWVGVIGTIGWIIFAGVTHFNAARAFSFPPGAFHLDHNFFMGLAAAMVVAAYDYWGYYNVCFFGGEVKDPDRNIPRALLISIVLVSAIYMVMNVSILGVLPWQELQQSAASDARLYVVSIFMERVYGRTAAYIVTALIMWTAFASVFSLLLGYSRVPYAAAVDGNYFKAFARVHPKHQFPYVSLLALGIVACAACFLRLADIIAALVVIRIMIQFLMQAIGVIVLRVRRPEMRRPFRMWLYPIPAVIAAAGFVYILLWRNNALREVRYAVVIVIAGVIIYLLRGYRKREWPFGQSPESALPSVGADLNG